MVQQTTNNGLLCDATIENDQQVVFKHLSNKHPSKDIAIAVGTVLTNGYTDEIYILEPTTATKEQYEGVELNTACGNINHIERYNLSTVTGPAGGLDIVRLHGVEFKEVKPVP